MRIETSENHLWGGVYLDPDYNEGVVAAVISQAQILYPDMGILLLKMEPMIAVNHLRGDRAQEQECSELIVMELERMTA